jgi:hypothetical protein
MWICDRVRHHHLQARGRVIVIATAAEWIKAVRMFAFSRVECQSLKIAFVISRIFFLAMTGRLRDRRYLLLIRVHWDQFAF